MRYCRISKGWVGHGFECASDDENGDMKWPQVQTGSETAKQGNVCADFSRGKEPEASSPSA